MRSLNHLELLSVDLSYNNVVYGYRIYLNSSAATINFSLPQVWVLIEGDSYYFNECAHTNLFTSRSEWQLNASWCTYNICYYCAHTSIFLVIKYTLIR